MDDNHPNSRPRFADIQTTADAIRSSDWMGVLHSAEVSQIEEYSTPLFAAADRLTANGDHEHAEALIVLAAAASMYQKPDDTREPLQPVFVTNQGRSVALVDFDDNHLGPMSDVLADISDPELRARIGDILWIRRKDHRAARIAFRAYLDRSKALFDLTQWAPSFRRLQRATQIAGSLGEKSEEWKEATKYALDALTGLNGEDPLYLSRQIMSLLLESKGATAATLALYAEKHAINSELSNDWMVAADYWGLTSTYHAKSGKTDVAQEALQKRGRAEVHVGEAMAASGDPNNAADYWLERGYMTLRQGGAPANELKPLQIRLHELQKEGLKRGRTIQAEIPVPQELVQHIDQAKGKSFREAIALWGITARPQKKEDLRQLVIDTQQNSLAARIPTTILREDGKVDCVIPPLSSVINQKGASMDPHMWQMRLTTRNVWCWATEYVREIVKEEHKHHQGEFDYLLDDNPFVPYARKALYARGLRAGIDGDWIVAIHLLVPQLENSLRYVLSQNGIITTFMCQDGTQDEYPLTKLIGLQEVNDIIGEDFTFELRGLLTERAGSNLRNNTAHGLLSEGAFFGPSVRLLVPLTILLLIGFQQPSKEHTDTPKS